MHTQNIERLDVNDKNLGRVSDDSDDKTGDDYLKHTGDPVKTPEEIPQERFSATEERRISLESNNQVEKWTSTIDKTKVTIEASKEK